MSINDFVKAIKEWSPDAEFKAVKDGEVYKSKGWSDKFDDEGYRAVTPHVSNPMEKKRAK